MKNQILALFAVFSLSLGAAFAQAPKSFNYQGVARDADGQVLSAQTIGIRVSILSQANPNDALYTETHQVKTNNFGLFALKIGQGEALLGNMTDIDWGSSAHYVSTEMDVHNNGHFVMMGTAPLLSVPYALYAEKSGSSMDGEAREIDFSGTFGQTIRHNGNDWEASSNIYNTSNNVGIGTTSPSEKLQVNGNIKIGATNQITIGNNRGLAVDASRNIMQGNQTGFSLTSGSNNNFIGHQAGKANTSGSNNSFIGYQSGLDNTTGSANSFFGYKAGGLNTTGSNNFYSGLQAGYGSTTGINNIAIGTKAGFSIGSANDNTFVGREAGLNTTNNRNTFIGKSAGDANTVGTENTYIGYNADGVDTLVNATAIGANTTVSTSNSLVLGNNANVGIGSSAPVAKLDVAGNIRMVDGNQQAGYILTSDTGGVMFWTNPLNVQNSAWIAVSNTVRTNPTLVDTDYDFVFGSTHLDYNGDTTYAERFFFDKSKGAFRAGTAVGPQWDDTLRGNSSIALGFDVTSSGDYSVAIGDRSRGTAEGAMALGHQAYSNGAYSYTFGNDVQAWADSAFVIGAKNKAFGERSFAIGIGVRANADNSVAIGFEAQADSSGSVSLGDGTVSSGINSMVIGFSSAASEENSVAIGHESFATAPNAVALGYSSFATGQSSIAFGDGAMSSGFKSVATGFLSEARGDQSAVFGYDAIAEGDSAMAIGYGVSTDGQGAVALGSYLAAPSAYETVLGRYNTNYIPSNDTIWQVGDRLLTVGNGTSNASRSDAMVILKSGNVGIGTSTPLGSLDVNGTIRMVDGNQAAGRIPVSSASGVMTWTDPSSITTADDGDWTVNGDDLYTAVSGNVGIGTSSPSSLLEVSNNNTPAIRLDQDGTGFPAQKWEMNGNEVFFNIRDVTNGGKIPFRIHTNAETDAIVIAQGGNVGIGTNSPEFTLDVDKDGDSQLEQMRMVNFNTGSSAGSGMVIATNGGGDSKIRMFAESGSNDRSYSLGIDNSAGTFAINNGNNLGTSGLNINSSNNIGIGTSAPEAKLHTYSSTLGEANGIKITQGVSNSVIYQNSDSDLILRKSNQTNQLVLDSGGNVGIGTNAPGTLLEVNGTASKPGGGSWAVSSDRRLKQDIQPYSKGLDKILAINPVTFHYNEKSGYDTEPEYVGVIAQELQKVAPDMVSTFEQDGTEYLRVDNSAMTYMLINAVKEQQQKIEKQELENQALKARLEALERLITTEK